MGFPVVFREDAGSETWGDFCAAKSPLGFPACAGMTSSGVWDTFGALIESPGFSLCRNGGSGAW